MLIFDREYITYIGNFHHIRENLKKPKRGKYPTEPTYVCTNIRLKQCYTDACITHENKEPVTNKMRKKIILHCQNSSKSNRKIVVRDNIDNPNKHMHARQNKHMHARQVLGTDT